MYSEIRHRNGLFRWYRNNIFILNTFSLIGWTIKHDLEHFFLLWWESSLLVCNAVESQSKAENKKFQSGYRKNIECPKQMFQKHCFSVPLFLKFVGFVGLYVFLSLDKCKWKFLMGQRSPLKRPFLVHHEFGCTFIYICNNQPPKSLIQPCFFLIFLGHPIP